VSASTQDLVGTPVAVVYSVYPVLHSHLPASVCEGGAQEPAFSKSAVGAAVRTNLSAQAVQKSSL
jgi:hypothetical protein